MQAFIILSLYNEGPKSALKVAPINAWYDDDAKIVNGYEVLNKYFDELFASNKSSGFWRGPWFYRRCKPGL